YQGLPPWGPIVPPGQYSVRLTVDGKSQTQPLELVNDPRSKVKEGDLRAEFELGMKTRALIDSLHVAVNQIRSTRAQMHGLAARLGGDAASKEVQAAIAAHDKRSTAIEGELIQVKLGSSEGMLPFPSMLNEQLDTYRFSIEADAAPTQPQLELYADFE